MTSAFVLPAHWKSLRDRVEHALQTHLPDPDLPASRLHEAMRYSTLDGGKRLRAIAVYAAGEMFDVAPAQLDTAAAAIEMVHAYSLIHDDLPAMDDDDLRRGRASCHKAFDEATAVLAGDALQSLAFEIIATDSNHSADVRVGMIACLANAIGPAGMAGGQALDLDAETRQVPRAELEAIHRRKTGALISAAVQIGALAAAERSASSLPALARFSGAVGLSFQIIDDVLDEESDTATLGKNSGSDREQNKSTYVSLLGVEPARKEAEKLHNDALASLDGLGDTCASLVALATFAIRRSF